MRRRQKHSGTFIEDPMINMTPLIDVVFVVLIMFIVVAPMLEIDKIELALGNHQSFEESSFLNEQNSIHLSVHQDDTIWVNKQVISVSQLVNILVDLRRKYPQKKLQVLHDRRAQFGTYQSVKNAAEIAGFSEMDVVLKPS